MNAEIDRDWLTFGPEEKLFIDEAEDWHDLTAVAGMTSDGVPYAFGFKEAGDMLVERGLNSQLQDLVAFPALFCYRHCLELILKEIAYEGQLARGEQLKLIGHHTLLEIWNESRIALEEAWPEGDGEQLDAVEGLVAELSEVDPISEQFRYDRNRKGAARQLPEKLKRFNLRHVRSMMDRLITLLMGGVDGIAAMRESAEP